MRRDLPEGFDYREMAPFIGWGRIMTVLVHERYASMRLFGRVIFLCYGVQRLSLSGQKRRYRYFRGWWHRPSLL